MTVANGKRGLTPRGADLGIRYAKLAIGGCPGLERDTRANGDERQGKRSPLLRTSEEFAKLMCQCPSGPIVSGPDNRRGIVCALVSCAGGDRRYILRLHAAILGNSPCFSFENTMALDIRGKTALVTGGASGIGLELTRQLLAGGCNVVIADLTLHQEAQEVTDAKHSDGARASFVETDVAKWDQLQKSFDYAVKEFGHLDIVVPGAGIFEPPVGPPVMSCHYTPADMPREFQTSGIPTRGRILCSHLHTKCSISTSHTLSARRR